MDASKYISVTGNEKLKLTDVQARRTAMANALRDLADEIEAGTRAVVEMQTFEMIGNNKNPTSILHLVSQLTTLPTSTAKK